MGYVVIQSSAHPCTSRLRWFGYYYQLIIISNINED